MIDPLLAASLCLVVVNWAVAATLLRLAHKPPKIQALTERAWLAALIAAVTTLTLLTEAMPILPSVGGLARVLMVAVSAYPLWWLVIYYRDGF